MKTYEFAEDNELTRDLLTKDVEFLTDASSYLVKRTGKDLEDPNEIYDAFMEQMRYHTVNELDTVSDLMYAQEAEDEDREQMARLFETFDRMDLDFTDELAGKIGDYGWGIVTAPSTYLGFVTGGSAKVATFAGQRAASAGLRRILAGMATGAIVEGGIGAGQNVAQQATRMELDPEREFSGTELALTTGLSAVPGAILGGVGQVKRNRLIEKADLLQQQADEAVATAEDLAKKQVKKVASDDSAGVKKVMDELAEDGFEAGALVERGKLNPIDPDLLEQGVSILGEQKRLVDEGYAVVLDTEVVQRVAVVAREIAKKGGVKIEQGQRITEAVAKAIANKEIPEEILTEIFDTYNISHRELGPIMASTASEAGKVLQAMGQVSKGWDDYIKTLRAQKAQKPGAQPADPDSAVEKFVKSPIRIANKIERLRRSILTSQPVTTIRNFFGGGARVTLDMFEEFWASGTRKAANTARKAMGLEPAEDISTLGAGDVARYVWNDEEAKMVADMYMRIDKKGYDRMFQNFIDAAEGSNNAATGDGFDRVGSFFNVFNRMSDNFWKKATFAGELSRQTRARYGKSLSDIISEGQFDKIEGDLFERAVEKSFELVYQQTPKGNGIFSKAARGYLDADKRAGFILGALIPFPRFVINQIKFMYEHAPVLGMLPIDSLTSKGGLQGFNWSKRVGQQINGLGMLGMAYALRDAMGPETEWYNYTKEDGTKLDLRPFLGPLNMQLYIADAIYRSGMFDGEPKPIKAAGGMTGEILQTAIGSSFRAGTGLFVVDRALPELLGSFDGEEPTIKTDQVIGQILGDYANTYTYQWPIAVARDLYSLTDEDLRQVPETKIGLDYLEITALRARRSLGPLADWLPKVSEDFMKQDIPYIPDVTIKHMFPFYNVDRPQERFDIFTPDPLRKVDPLRTAVSGLNISPAANAFIKERIRLQLEPYDIYRAHPFPPADRYIRQELAQRLPMQMEKVIKSPEYQKLSDAEKKVVYVREAKYLMNEIRNKTRIDELIAKEMKLGRIADATERDHLKWKFESLPKMYREAVKSRLGAPTEDSDYGDYLKEYDVIKESWFNSKKMATGGLVQSFAVGGTPTPIDEQMDALSLSETLEEQQAPDVSIGEYIGMLGDLRRGITGGAMTGQADMVKFIDDAIDYVRGQDADLDAPLTQLTEATLGKYGREITGDSEIAQASSKLIGENLGVIESIAPGFKILGNTLPDTLGIFVPAKKAADKNKRYEELMSKPLRKGETEADRAERVRQETNIGAIEGLDDAPRLEIDDSSVPLNVVRKKDQFTDKEVFFGSDGLPLGHPKSKLTMGDIFPHEEFFTYYPEARKLPIMSQPGTGGSFNLPYKGEPAKVKLGEDTPTETGLRETLVHELQHFVQWSERLNAGGNQTAFTLSGLDNIAGVLSEAGKNLHQRDAIQNALRNKGQTYAVGYGEAAWDGFKNKILQPLRSADPDVVERKQKQIKRLFGDEVANDLIEYSKFADEYEKLQQEPFKRYMLLAGEVEARMTGDRVFMSPARRQKVKPDVEDLLKSDERRYDFKYDNYDLDQLMQARHRGIGSDAWGHVFGDAYRKAIRSSEKKATDLIDRMRESKIIDVSDDANVLLNQARTSIQKDSMNKRSYLYTMEGLDSPQAPVIDATDRFAQKRVADTFKTTKVLDADQEAEVADFYKTSQREGLDEDYMDQAVGKYLMNNGYFPDVKLGEKRKLYFTAPDGTRHPYIIRVDDVNVKRAENIDTPEEGVEYFDIGTGTPVQRNVTVEVLDDGFDFADEPGEEIVGQVYDMPYEYFLDNTEMMGGLRAVDDAVEELAPAKKGLGRRTEKVDKDADQGRQHALETKERFRAPEEMREELGEGFGSTPEMREFFATNPTRGEVLQKRLELAGREAGLMRTSDTKSLDDMISLPNSMAGQYHPYEFFDIDVPEGRKTTDAFKAAHKARRKEWLKRSGKGPNKEVGKRNMRMQDAAKQVIDGKLSAAEFRKIADEEMPLTMWDKLPELATNEDMVMALDPNKVRNGIVGLTDLVEQGDYITSRLDIPAYENFDTWVVTLLPSKGKNVDLSDVHGIKYKKSGSVYANAVHMRDVNFVPTKDFTSKKALETAAGAGKNPYAAFEGRYMDTDPEGIYNASEDFLQESLKEGSDWIQVGFDPRRRGFFYDRRTGEPVLSADEIVQIGPLVLAKKAIKGDADDFVFNKGGLMSRK